MNLTIRSRFSFIASSILFLLLAASVMPRIASAQVGKGDTQIEKDTTHWNDEDLYKEDNTAPSFFSVGGGVIGGYFMPNLSSFNTNIAQPFVGQNVKEHAFMIGGQGFVTVPWVKNLRLGGMGYSGAAPCGCSDTSIGGSTMNRFLEYEVGYGALTVDYVLPIRTGKFHIVPGVALGYGSVNIYARQAQTRDFDITKDFALSGNAFSPNVTHTYTSNFFLYMPQLQFEYTVAGFMMLRLSGGYQGTVMGDWSVDRGVALTNTTGLSGVNGSGLIANFGVFFGLFQ